MELEWFTTPSGRCPVLIFIKGLPPQAGQRVLKEIEHLEDQGLQLLGSPKLKPLEGKLKGHYELRCHYDRQEFRIGIIKHEGKFHLVHGFKKKSQMTRQEDLETIYERFQSIKRTEGGK